MGQSAAVWAYKHGRIADACEDRGTDKFHEQRLVYFNPRFARFSNRASSVVNISCEPRPYAGHFLHSLPAAGCQSVVAAGMSQWRFLPFGDHPTGSVQPAEQRVQRAFGNWSGRRSTRGGAAFRGRRAGRPTGSRARPVRYSPFSAALPTCRWNPWYPPRDYGGKTAGLFSRKLRD